ncbi:TatD DNase family protein [Aquimarina sp. EL_43]|uniref:TatD family hydrolase n=1 Tax=Aquimarina TaxID=290174 RepID=UPI00046FB096|nr:MULTISPECIES: TatD family hydrolase [Aquimarina]MBG6133047.1 TatD DNase family protein [Aquimarina sp. EL_35]MBG6152358.1 TatD DNase family protein [Aquimarina sp. EL_32]MBG6171196.1 TatD DNase family protein [Aquimarina sp. EL_43]
MILTDTHTHIYSEAFDEDQDEMMQRAIKNGVTRFFVPAIDSTYTNAMYAIETKYPKHVFLMMGLHPTHVKENYKEELVFVENELKKRSNNEVDKNFYAIGEIGIDLYWDKTFLKAQQEAFKYQIQLAKKYKLPIVIHCREAFEEIFEVLESEKSDDLFGIFHCFTGTIDDANRAIGYNMKLGIGGVVTFKNGKIDRFLNQISLDHIVLETDAPYLAPTPYRGKRNESSYLLNILEKLSDIYQKPIEEIAAITTKNSSDIFGI